MDDELCVSISNLLTMFKGPFRIETNCKSTSKHFQLVGAISGHFFAFWIFAESRWQLYWGCGKAWPPCFRWSRPRAWRCRCWGATSCSRWCWWRCPSASPPSSSTSTTASRAPTACPPGSAASSSSACRASSAWGCPSRLVGPNFSFHIFHK